MENVENTPSTPSGNMVLRTDNLVKKYGKRTVANHVSIEVTQGEIVGLRGPNGAGKTTTFYMTVGLVTPNEGHIYLDNLDITKYPVYKRAQNGIGYLAQEPSVFRKLSVENNIKAVLQMTPLSKEEQQEKLESLITEFRLQKVRKNLGDQLSGGERRRVALCRLLLQQPDVLLLDEPTNHLDAESIDWLEQHLQQYPGTVIAITHDRYFLDHVAGWILELDRGEGIPWKGNYTSWLDQKTKRMAQEEKQASKRRKTLERELEWVRMAPKARQAKGKARLNSYDRLLNEDQKDREEKLEIFIPNGPRLGNKVIEAASLAKAFGHKQLFKDLNFTLPPNGIVGVIGPNGAGKTTLFKLIMGQEAPDAGSFDVGETVKIAYVDQTHHDLLPEKSVYEVISQGVESFRMGGRDVNARAYLSKFNFSGADQEKKVGVLSGGERNRLHLAMALKQEGNVLLLDEPTNDIDVNTLRALEEGLEQFAGCAVVVSHDRWFLDRICTHILSFEGDGEVVFYEGSYSDYEEYKKAHTPDGKEPRRRRYRKLME